MRLDNAARGLAGDAGEVSSAVMRYIEYGRELDRTNLIEEVGDCLWRLNQVCAAAGFTLEQAMDANISKLQARYPKKYSDERAANRDIEAERRALETTYAGAPSASEERSFQDGHGFGHTDEKESDNEG
jgi:NTP pyrophosphatase (non-canonical NTP hydrolase)